MKYQKALIFKDEINEELIRVIGKTFGEARGSVQNSVSASDKS